MTLPEDLERFAAFVGPDPDDVQVEMDARADELGFPTVGRAVGGWLRLLAELVEARRVFEFGSGFGYSAYWFARGLPADGTVVLTEIDADELEQAREYFDRGGLSDRAAFEHGDAIEVVDDYEGPFEAVLIDNEKHRYVEAFEAVRGKVPRGGVVCADNVTGGPIEFETVDTLLRGEADPDAVAADADAAGPGSDAVEANEAERGIVDYVRRVRDDPAFETALLPLGEGVAVSRRLD